MREYIYYPGFEVRDELWLKFALLYIEKINPIIPPSADARMSAAYQQLTDNTDLIEPHRPTDIDSFRASEIAITTIERALRRPASYSRVFKESYLSKWQNQGTHGYTLYWEKFTDDFESFCTKNCIGTKCDEGIRLPEDLAFLYMTYLAIEIGKERNLPIITDYQKYDRIKNTFTYGQKQKESAENAARYLIKLAVPSNLSEIPLAEIIRLRESQDYLLMLKAFNRELSKYLDAIKDGEVSFVGFQDYLDSKNTIMGTFLQRSWQLASVVLGTWILFPEPTMGHILRNTVVGMGAFVTDSVINYKNIKQTHSDNINASRFLTNLQSLRKSMV